MSACTPHKKTPVEEKGIRAQHRDNIFTHSKQRALKYQIGTEPPSSSNSNRSHQNPNEKNNHNRFAIYDIGSIEIEKQSKWPPKISKSFSILQQCNRNSKTASESPEPFKPSLKMAMEMNEVNYKPIDSCINTLNSSIDLMKSTGKWNVPRLASQTVQARNKRINCPNTETNTLYQRRMIEWGTQTRHRSKLPCTSDGHCFDQGCAGSACRGGGGCRKMQPPW